MALEAVVNGKKKKTVRKGGETLRFKLELVQSSDETTNEFFYTQLVEDKTEKPSSGSTEGDGPAPFRDDLHEHDKLAAIARGFEEKYGSGPKKKKRKLHDMDLVDKGHGYDISDSFVDDSELYEDFVPPQVDTVFGGFYVNTGQLDFKCRTDLDPEEADFVMKKKKPKIKKTISHQKILATQKLKKAKQTALHKTPSKTAKKLLAGSGVSPLIKQVTLTKLKPEKKLKKSSKLPFSSTPLKTVTSDGPHGSSNLSTKIDVDGLTVPVLDSTSKLKDMDISEPLLNNLSQGEEQAEKAPPPPKEPPVLQESLLPPEVLARVKDLEETIRWDQGNGKKLSTKTRSGYDEKLVDIELLCKAVTLRIRNTVFEFLAYKMGVAKSTLTKRMKAVLKKREDDELEEPLQKLKIAIEESMHEQMAEYEEAKRTESLSSERVSEVEEESKMEDVVDDSTLVVPSGGGGGSQMPGASLEGAKTKKTIVRKKYKWSDETRKLLCDVVKIKVNSEERCSRITRGNGEDIVSQFLDEKVRPLWPKGWMQKSVLYKMSEVAHKDFTCPQPKKATPVRKEKLLSIKKELVDSPKPSPASPATASVASPATASLTSSPQVSAIPPTPTPPSTSTSSPRAPIPTDPRELVAFLLKDDTNDKTKDLIKKIVLSHSAKVMGEKGSTAQPAKPVSTSAVASVSAVKPLELPKSSSAKKASLTATSRSPKVSISPIVSSAGGVGASPKSKTLAAFSQTAQLKTSSAAILSPSASSKNIVGLPGRMPHATVPSLQKTEKKKKTKTPKNSTLFSLSSSKNSSAKTSAIKTSAVIPSHLLTTSVATTSTATGEQRYVLQLVKSATGGGDSLLQLSPVVAAAGSLLPSSTAATTSNSRLFFTSSAGSQQLKSTVAQSSSDTKLSAPVKPSSHRVKSLESVDHSVLKGGTSIKSAPSVSGLLKQQQVPALQASVKTTPVIQIPRVSPSAPSLTTTKVSTLAPQVSANTAVVAPTPPPLTGSSTHPPSNKASNGSLVSHASQQQVLVASTPVPLPTVLPQLETTVLIGQPQPPQAQVLLNTAPSSFQKTVVTAVPAQGNIVSLTAGTPAAIVPTLAQTSLHIPPLSTLTSSVPTLQRTTAGAAPLLQKPLPLNNAHQTTASSRGAPHTPPLPLKESHPRPQTIADTPPLYSAHFPQGQQKEPSPLKSPVEQIMEEHSYLGNHYHHPQQLHQQSDLAWPLQSVGVTVLQSHLNDPNMSQ